MYARAKDIDFSSAKKVKEKLDQKIEDLQQPQASNHTAAASSQPARAARAARIAAFERRNGPGEMAQLYAILIKNNKNFALIFMQFSTFIVIIISTRMASFTPILLKQGKFSEITVQKT